MLFDELFDVLSDTVPYDIYEYKDRYEIDLQAPGRSKEDFDLEVNSDKLIITGRKNKPEKGEGRLVYGGIPCRDIECSFKLPSGTEPSKITASYDAGILSVVVSKCENKSATRIAIK